jgi:hypothetical protein
MFDDAVRILREDAGIAQNRTLLERLDRIDQQTRRDPQTPEEKAAAYDKLMAEKSRPGPAPTPGNEPQKPAGQPTPPAQKPPAQSQETKPDWWWGSES